MLIIKKILVLFLVSFSLIGCASVGIPKYIKDNHPYKHTFYADFDTVLDATLRTLDDLDWKVAAKSDPAIYEQNKVLKDPQAQQILILTEVRPAPLSAGKKNARLNIYLLQNQDKRTEVEIRYLTLTSVPFKSFFDYKADAIVDKILQVIDEKLGQ